ERRLLQHVRALRDGEAIRRLPVAGARVVDADAGPREDGADRRAPAVHLEAARHVERRAREGRVDAERLGDPPGPRGEGYAPRLAASRLHELEALEGL